MLTSPGLLAIASMFVVGILAVMWWLVGPGAMQRRKRARQEVWLNAHADFIQRKEREAKRPVKPTAVDREAMEREVRRWD